MGAPTDARQGQWLSADPILADYMQGRPVVGVYRPTNLALYSYAWNNPVSVEDPDGRCPECTFAALRETPEESAAVNEAGKNVAAGMWNSLVRKASATMVAVLLGRPVYAPPPTQEEINNAYENSGAKDLEDAALIDDVPIEAEIAGEVLADMAIGGVVKGASPKLSPRSLPTLTKGPGGKMLGEAVGHLKKMSGSERASAFKEFAQQIEGATNGQWSAKALDAKNGRVFAGEGGEALVFDEAGNMFRGNLSDRNAFSLGEKGQLEINYGGLREL